MPGRNAELGRLLLYHRGGCSGHGTAGYQTPYPSRQIGTGPASAALQAPVVRQEGDFPRAQVAMARLAIALGDLDTVDRWVRQSGVDVHDEIAPLYAAVYPYLGLARLLIARGRNNPTGTHLREVAALLTRLSASAEKTGRTSQSIEILILQALVLDAQGRTSEALSPLQRALQLAEPEGYVRIFIDESAPMEELLKRSKSSSQGAPGLAGQRLRADGIYKKGGLSVASFLISLAGCGALHNKHLRAFP